MSDDRMDEKREAGNGPKEWYTVREAAEYLGVSQPTIFRWMKDGTLSFYKIGAATRFSREGLDAVIEKSTGRKEAQKAAERCMACGHSRLVEGQLRGAGKLYFKPEESRFWVLSEAMVPTSARVCTACGLMQLYAGTDKLAKLNGQAPQDMELEENTHENPRGKDASK